MPTRLTIGQFARMTYLSATTLRHYHAVGLLEPADVDPATGYRHYTTDQLGTAHVIRRLRGLDMSIDDVRAVVASDDAGTRNAVIAAHLSEMEDRLRATTAAVASLRDLLTTPVDVLAIDYRTVAPTPAWTITADVRLADIGDWAPVALRELVHAVGGRHRAGPPSVLYEPAFFEAGIGRVTAYVATARDDEPPGRIAGWEVPAADLAVGLHRGPASDLDRSYGAVGRVVAEQGIGVDGPIREHFLGRAPGTQDVELVEVGWPIDRSRAA